MHRRAARIDDNQPEIVDTLRKVPGFTVWVTSMVGKGAPDVVCGYLGVCGLYEIKDPSKPPSKRALTSDEKDWHAAWRGHIRVVETAAEIVTDMREQAKRIIGRAS